MMQILEFLSCLLFAGGIPAGLVFGVSILFSYLLCQFFFAGCIWLASLVVFSFLLLSSSSGSSYLSNFICICGD
ncbi:hypothetical protein KFK09_003496 [Dendrobium nobile]|uniref:Uncharacterized protein n=1 Tax=Dendrobium nobile TaxID=94219 RepID=A0A8T3BXR9_DENNO|nr:hypothetical protein KFK09_003496 [Dendrobium nobile]